MKKKFRNINVNGVDYAWNVRNDCDGDGNDFVRIWLLQSKGTNKTIIFDDMYDYSDEEERRITPKKIKELILSVTKNS